MNRRLHFFYVPSMAHDNEEALRYLREQIKALRLNADIESESCLENMKDMFLCPFVSDSMDGTKYYGLQGLQAFAKREQARLNGSFAHTD